MQKRLIIACLLGLVGCADWDRVGLPQGSVTQASQQQQWGSTFDDACSAYFQGKITDRAINHTFASLLTLTRAKDCHDLKTILQKDGNWDFSEVRTGELDLHILGLLGHFTQLTLSGQRVKSLAPLAKIKTLKYLDATYTAPNPSLAALELHTLPIGQIRRLLVNVSDDRLTPEILALIEQFNKAKKTTDTIVIAFIDHGDMYIPVSKIDPKILKKLIEQPSENPYFGSFVDFSKPVPSGDPKEPNHIVLSGGYTLDISLVRTGETIVSEKVQKAALKHLRSDWSSALNDWTIVEEVPGRIQVLIENLKGEETEERRLGAYPAEADKPEAASPSDTPPAAAQPGVAQPATQPVAPPTPPVTPPTPPAAGPATPPAQPTTPPAQPGTTVPPVIPEGVSPFGPVPAPAAPQGAKP